MKFYGIYTEWSECQKNILGFKGAIFKSFPDIKDAENYIDNDISTKQIYVDA